MKFHMKSETSYIISWEISGEMSYEVTFHMKFQKKMYYIWNFE